MSDEELWVKKRNQQTRIENLLVKRWNFETKSQVKNIFWEKKSQNCIHELKGVNLTKSRIQHKKSWVKNKVNIVISKNSFKSKKFKIKSKTSQRKNFTWKLKFWQKKQKMSLGMINWNKKYEWRNQKPRDRNSKPFS